MLPTTFLTVKSPGQLEAAMKKAGLSTRQLGSRADVSPSRVTLLLNGQHPSISAQRALAIAEQLDVDASDLFYFPDAPALRSLGIID